MQPRVFALGLWAAVCAFKAMANEASMTIACQSIQMYPATAVDLTEFNYAIEYTSDVDGDGNFASTNNEWIATDGTIGYATSFKLDNTDLDFSYAGTLAVDIPLAGDLNLNFITDFFEVDRAVSAETTGTIDLSGVSRDVTASWSRSAGQTTGHVRLTFSSPSQQIAELTFDHTFEIYQFSGKLTYTPATAAGSDVAASVELTRVGGDTQFTGPLPLKVNDVQGLERKPTHWAGPNQQDFEVLGSFEIPEVELTLDHVGARPWYVGSFFFLDGNPATAFQDEYDLWDVFIKDPNDADHDGVPDLSDPVGIIPVEPPTLSIAITATGLQLTIGGQAGATVNLEERPALTAGEWTTVQTVTLDGTSKTIPLNVPVEDYRFWRATSP